MARIAVTTEQQVTLDPALSARVSAILSTYHELKAQADLLYEIMDGESQKIRALMEGAGHEKIEIDGTPCTIVRGTSSKLDKVKFVQLGGSLAQLENATTSKPKKVYLRIGKEKEE